MIIAKDRDKNTRLKTTPMKSRKQSNRVLFSIPRQHDTMPMTSMLISTKATDTIYQAVLHLLKRQGIEENETLQQRVLLRDAMFVGYRFQGGALRVDWLAQTNTLVVVDPDNKILHQEQLSTQNTNRDDIALENQQDSVAA